MQNISTDHLSGFLPFTLEDMLSTQPVHVWGMDAHSNEGWLITSGKDIDMWVIHQISNLNTGIKGTAFKPTLHFTNNNGEGRSIQLNTTADEMRRLTIQQLEDIANGSLSLEVALK